MCKCYLVCSSSDGATLDHVKQNHSSYTVKVKFLSYAKLVCNAFCAAVLSWSGLEGDLFEMGMWSLGLGAVGAALAGIFLANTDLCLTKPAKASLEYLEDADLRCTLNGRSACCMFEGLVHAVEAFLCNI